MYVCRILYTLSYVHMSSTFPVTLFVCHFVPHWEIIEGFVRASVSVL